MLPAKPEFTRNTPPEIAITAGSWWELRGENADIAAMPLLIQALPPRQPLLLLVTEVRVHDGEAHTVILAPHPAWDRSRMRFKDGIRVLTEDFLRNFSPVDTALAERVRDEEMRAQMGLITRITEQISAGAPAAEVLKLESDIRQERREKAIKEITERIMASDLPYEDRRRKVEEVRENGPEETSAPTGNLPAALLPSGDVVAAQKMIEEKALAMEAVQRWIVARSGDMTRAMSVVSGYQAEKVNATVAVISDQRQKAESLLKNVHTMRLFLGEGVDLTTAVSGDSAPAEEKLHLMQRMLYLDEEIFVESMFGKGFTHEDMRDLGALFAQNPGLVERMLPYQRCVAVARIRRKERPLHLRGDEDIPTLLGKVMEHIDKAERDKRVLIMIRDGENVRLAFADQDTSKAARLFPSAAEIDAIYHGESTWGKRSSEHGEITPGSLEYSDRRNEHDDRALFYKRFLILLWGLHEREDAFGPFLQKGENWLHQSIASERFVFVHDEENVLSSGRKPIREMLATINADIRPGTRVAILPRIAMNEDTAPTAYKEDKGGRSYKVRHPVNRIETGIVSRKGDDLIVQIETSISSWRTDSTQKTPLIIRTPTGTVPDGIVNLDAISASDMEYYANSRLQREDYLSWLPVFHDALPEVRRRDLARAGEMRALVSAGFTAAEATRAISLHLSGKRRDEPAPSDRPVIRRIADAVRAARPGQGESVSVNDKGESSLLRIGAREDGILLPVMRSESGEERLASIVPAKAELLVRDPEALRKDVHEVHRMITPGFLSTADIEAARSLRDMGRESLFPEIDRDTAISFAQTYARMHDRRDITSVKKVFLSKTCGVVVFPTRMVRSAGSFYPYEGRTYRLVAMMELIPAIINAGHEDIARRANLYKKASNWDVYFGGTVPGCEFSFTLSGMKRTESLSAACSEDQFVINWCRPNHDLYTPEGDLSNDPADALNTALRLIVQPSQEYPKTEKMAEEAERAVVYLPEWAMRREHDPSPSP